MKILFITVRSDFGGGPKHVDQLLNALPNECDIYMSYPKIGVPYADKWQHNDHIKGSLFIPYRKFSIRKLLDLKKFIKHNHIDIVHSHGNGAGIYSRLLKLLVKEIKVVHTFHGISDVYSSKLKYYLSLIIGRLLSKFADMYICVSNNEKTMAIERKFSYSSNTVVIYNGILPIDSKKFKNDNIFRIITISRFNYQKNMDSMFRIASNWKASNKVKFVWVGDGEDRKRLEDKAKQNNIPIEFVGFTTDPYSYLFASDLYLSTSRFEGLPYALVEALSVGLPIVATDVKGNNEVVKDGYNGFLFKDEDTAIDIISKFEHGLFDYHTLSSNAIFYFEQKFTESKMIDNLVELYHTILTIN